MSTDRSCDSQLGKFEVALMGGHTGSRIGTPAKHCVRCGLYGRWSGKLCPLCESKAKAKEEGDG
jgi:hypothetical protein